LNSTTKQTTQVQSLKLKSITVHPSIGESAASLCAELTKPRTENEVSSGTETCHLGCWFAFLEHANRVVHSQRMNISSAQPMKQSRQLHYQNIK